MTAGDKTSKATYPGHTFSEKFKQGPYQILRCDPATGEMKGVPTDWMHSIDVAKHFSHFGFDIETLRSYAVRAAGGYAFTGEEFLEEHPAEAVVAAWTAGAPAARSSRQQKLTEWWPALGSALQALEQKIDDNQ